MRKAIVTAGVAYHHALTQPGQPLSAFEPLEVHTLPMRELADFNLVVVPRSVSNEALWVRRHQFARFLDGGGVLVAFGEAWTNWFPGCHWERESMADLGPPVLAAHALLDGLAPEDLTWHAHGPNWCNHGHLVAPPSADVLVANTDGNAWLYVDRVSTPGVIIAASNLDLDTHVFNGNPVARLVLDRLLRLAQAEAAQASEGTAGGRRRVAFVYSGVHFQRGLAEDAEFGAQVAVLPAEELGGADLSRYPAVWVPRESNQALLVRHRDRLLGYLARGGTLVTFDEINQPWLPGVEWVQRRVELDTLTLAPHPLLAGLRLEDVQWHAHGAFVVPLDATALLPVADGLAALYLDEHRFAPGRVLAGTVDPDCHVGYGSHRPRALLRNLFAWALAPRRVRVEVA